MLFIFVISFFVFALITSSIRLDFPVLWLLLLLSTILHFLKTHFGMCLYFPCICYLVFFPVPVLISLCFAVLRLSSYSHLLLLSCIVHGLTLFVEHVGNKSFFPAQYVRNAHQWCMPFILPQCFTIAHHVWARKNNPCIPNLWNRTDENRLKPRLLSYTQVLYS